jgi:hypothetical protein
MSTYQYTQDLPMGIRNLIYCMEGYSLETIQFLRERFSLNDLENRAISNITQKHLTMRLTDPELRSGIRVIEAQWEPANDTYTVFFEMEPSGGTPAKVLTTSAREYQGTFYNTVFQFQGPSKWLGTPAEFQQKTAEQQIAAIEEMIMSAEAKLYSNDPSFYYQGMWEDLATVGGAMFPFPGPKGDGVWRARHAQAGGLANPMIRITKHMGQVIGNIGKLISEIRDKTRIR